MQSIIPPFLASFKPVADAIQALLAPHAEVVIHDLSQDRIVYIANCFSKRAPGDESLLDEDVSGPDNPPVLGPYDKLNYDGRRLRSVSAVLHNADGTPVGLLCINLDLSRFEAAATLLRQFVEPPGNPPPESLFSKDWRERIHHETREFLAQRNMAFEALERTDKIDLVVRIQAAGLFEARHACDYVASQLGVSRATIYNYLRSSGSKKEE